MNKSRRDDLNKRERSILKAIQEGIIDNGYHQLENEKSRIKSTATVPSRSGVLKKTNQDRCA